VESDQYSVFTGRVLDREVEGTSRTPHYYILVDGGGQQFRVAVNTRSGTSHFRKADLLYFADDDFRHPITHDLEIVADGILAVTSQPGGLALDYQRGGMFDHRDMRRIPADRPGPHNDLVEELDDRVQRAILDPAIRLHAYGTRWGPERRPDHVFGFQPGNGIHDVHMNQGNWDEHWRDNAIWSDGGLIFHDPGAGRWSALFLAFQTQSWYTDDQGDPIRSDYGRHASRRRHASGHDGSEDGITPSPAGADARLGGGR
jgi:uncharacterized protein YukJ